MMVFDNTMRPLEHMRPPGTPHDAELAERGRRDFAVRADILSKALERSRLSARVRFLRRGHSGRPQLFHGHVTGLIGDFPVLEAYYARLQQRPGHRRAYGN